VTGFISLSGAHDVARIEHFALFAQDAPALKDFYVRTMGMTVALESGGDPPGYFLADDHGAALEIIGRPPGASGANPRWICHIAFLVDDVAARRAELESQGLAFETGTEVDTPSMKTAFFHDPEGNRCQIVWRSKPLVP
jgi:glyoxylase I family protein